MILQGGFSLVYPLINIHLLNWPEKYKINHLNFKMPQILVL